MKFIEMIRIRTSLEALTETLPVPPWIRLQRPERHPPDELIRNQMDVNTIRKEG